MSDLLPPDATAEDYYQAALAIEPKLGCQSIPLLQKAVELNPNYLDAWYNLATALQWNGDFQAALDCYDRILTFVPDSERAWSGRGFALHNLNQFEAALTCYDRAIALNPDTEIWANRGAVLAVLNREEEAILSYDRAIHLLETSDEPDDQELSACYADKGDILFELGRYEEAIATYEQAGFLNAGSEENYRQAYVSLGRESELLERYDQEVDQPSIEGSRDTEVGLLTDWRLNQKGDVLMAVGRYTEAIACYWQAFELNPEWHPARIQEALLKLGHSEAEATDLLLAGYDRAIANTPDNPQLWYLRASLLYGASRYEAALASFDRALDLNPDDDSYWYERALTLEKLGRYEEVVTSCDQTLAAQARRQFPPDHFALRLKAESLTHLKRWEEAIPIYEAAISAAPFLEEEWGLWHRRGLALFELGDFTAAIASYEHAIPLLEQLLDETNRNGFYKPWLATVWFNLGVAQARLEQWAEAIASYDRALACDPQHFGAQYWRSFPLLNLERYDEALSSFDRALELKPDYVEAWLERGFCLQDLDRGEDAIVSFQKALDCLNKQPSPDVNFRNQVYLAMGDVLSDLGRDEEAKIAYDQVSSDQA